MSIKVKYGTLAKWGTGWKYGYGVSEPWTPLETPATVPRFSVETDAAISTAADTDTTPTFTSDTDSTPTYTADGPP